MKKADNFNTKQWLAENKVTFHSRLNEEQQYSSERVNPRDQEVQSGVVNHYFDTIDMMDMGNGYKVKVTTTYYFRDPGVKGYSDTNSEENPGISGVKTTLMDPSGKPIKNHNFTGSGQWWMLTSGKKYFMPQIKAWWEEKMGRMGLEESRLNEGRWDGWDFDDLVNYLIELADELDGNPQLEKKLDNILYRTIDIENIHDYDEEDIQRAIKQLERLKNSAQK